MRAFGLAPLGAGIVLVVVASAGPSSAASVIFQERSAAPPNNACDRACLDAWSDRYMAALVAHDPGRLPWARDARFSENNVMLKPGDGLWKTISGKGGAISELHYADVAAQQAGFMSMVRERDYTAYYSMRLKIVDGRIAEVETVVNRIAPSAGAIGPGGGAGFTPSTPESFRHFPGFGDIMPVGRRVGRGRYQDITWGYYATLQLNDGALFTQFADDCSRSENGSITSGGNLPNGQRRPSCREQFASGNYRTDTSVPDREIILIDEEKGLVLARDFIHHTAAATTIRNAAGEERPSTQRSPSSFFGFVTFKIIDGKINKVEALTTSPPYHSTTPWRRVDADIADFSATAAWTGGDK